MIYTDNKKFKFHSPNYNTGSGALTLISAYTLNASGALTTGDISGTIVHVTPDSYGKLSEI